MEPIIILQVITITISFVSIFINVFVTIRENKKNNFVKFTTKNRIDILVNLREKYAKILTLSSPLSIREVKSANEKNYIRELIRTNHDIKQMLKVIYADENEILVALDKMVKSAISYYYKLDKDIEIELTDNAENLAFLSAIYDSAYWEYIQEQVKGKFYDDKDFILMHEKFRSKFQKAK